MRTIADIRSRLSVSNPLAPVDRVYRLAQALVRLGARPSRHDEPSIREVWRFLKARAAAANSHQRAQVVRDFPDLTTAFDLRFEKAQRLRWAIEAYLLSELDPAKIAAKFGVSVGVIVWYATVFFNVSHLKASPLRIVLDVVRAVDDRGRITLDAHKVWKLVALHQRSIALDRLLELRSSETTAPGDVVTWLSSTLALLARTKQMLSLESIGNDLNAIASLAKVGPDHAAKKPGDPAQLNSIEQGVKAMLENLPFASGDDAQKQFAGTEIGALDEGATELRADELMRLSAGEEVEGLEEIRNFELPPPRPRIDPQTKSKSPLEETLNPQRQR